MNLSDFKNITKFLEENKEHNFRFEIGEVGFGRPALGILSGDSYVDYCIFDEEYRTVAECKTAYKKAPKNAYHKHECLAVLMYPADYAIGPSDTDKQKALQELDGWIQEIMKAGYKVQDHLERSDSIGSLIGKGRATLKAIVDKEKENEQRN